MVRNSGPSSHIVKSLVDAFGKIGKKTRSKDRNAARRVLSQAIVNKNTKLLGFLKPTCKIVNLNVKTLRRYSIRREHLDTTDQTDFWAFIGRLPRRDMKLVDAVKGLVHSIFIIYLQSYYAGHIYAVVAGKDSEWAGDYWLAHCIEGKQTLNMSMNDDENNHFPIGSMVVKGAYLT